MAPLVGKSLVAIERNGVVSKSRCLSQGCQSSERKVSVLCSAPKRLGCSAVCETLFTRGRRRARPKEAGLEHGCLGEIGDAPDGLGSRNTAKTFKVAQERRGGQSSPLRTHASSASSNTACRPRLMGAIIATLIKCLHSR